MHQQALHTRFPVPEDPYAAKSCSKRNHKCKALSILRPGCHKNHIQPLMPQKSHSKRSLTHKALPHMPQESHSAPHTTKTTFKEEPYMYCIPSPGKTPQNIMPHPVRLEKSCRHFPSCYITVKVALTCFHLKEIGPLDTKE